MLDRRGPGLPVLSGLAAAATGMAIVWLSRRACPSWRSASSAGLATGDAGGGQGVQAEERPDWRGGERSETLRLIAHRGWSAGAGENTLAAFRRAAAEPAVSGVELDLRRAADGSLVVSHDPPDAESAAFDEVVRFISGTGLEAFVELKEPGLGPEAAGALAAAGLADRAVIFGPGRLLDRSEGGRQVRLGIMEPYPWRIPGLAATFTPDVILLGWDDRAWTRLAFRAWWSIFSLRRMGRRHSAAIVVGVARRASDVRWLRRQGIDAAVVDMTPSVARDAFQVEGPATHRLVRDHGFRGSR